MITKPPADQFEIHLENLRTSLQSFYDILIEERDILEKNKLDLLENLLNTKQGIIQQIQGFFQQYQPLFTNQTMTEGNMLEIISQYPAITCNKLLKLWNDIKNLLQSCERKNLANGVTITTMKNYNDALLRLITKRPAEMAYTNLNKKFNVGISTREHKA